MAKGREKPALYELISKRPRAAALRPAPGRDEMEEPSFDEPAEDTILGISPGRVVRMPIGIVFLIAFALLAAVFGAYQIGHHQGGEAMVDRLEAKRLEGELAIRPTDPLNEDDPARAVANNDLTIRDMLDQSRSQADQTSPPPPGGSANLILVDADAEDPRESGLNYQVLAYVRRDEAERAGQFLAERDIRVARLPVDPRGRTELVALEGFPGGQLNSREARRYRDRLRQLGREYRSQGGTVDFSDSYWKRFD